MRALAAAWMLCICLIAPLHSAWSKPLAADISSHYITLSSGFKGTQLMLFGARNDAGDVIVVVRGPARKAVVRKKEKVSGIWINRQSQNFDRIPGFYVMKTSRPFDEIMKSSYFEALGIGEQAAITPFLPALDGSPTPRDSAQQMMHDPKRKDFATSLLQYLSSNELYASNSGAVEFIEETLFKTTINFPDTTPRGIYTAEVYLFSDGVLVGSYTFPIEVFKVGLDAFIYQSAQEHPALYGLGAVLLALAIGWAASEIFRRI